MLVETNPLAEYFDYWNFTSFITQGLRYNIVMKGIELSDSRNGISVFL